MKQNYLNLLGIAYRARQCSLGVAKIIDDIRKKRVKLVIIASDCGTQTYKQLTDKCNSYDVPYVVAAEKSVISHAIGQTNRVAIAILNDGFARKLKQLITGN